ncbi:MAG: hypothetical protein EOS54_28840 [Mesorhizobium sp.]|uniref:hypothetical protein n=1 Tax=unclassified Mesorhizobium TaxID=325217 RepID=UPI000FD56C26|nr:MULTISPECIES: hypothetical protein [unclassified Mesorhizobium]RVD36079.1 hypothetical protein EN742_23465 [Mesorhizobium sp. M4A.F.Ca.ET.020.02.1.1]RWC08468.1 MAG: hypothetical protein EOS53_31925 [Mesorhizobium sp.]RWC25832.1 MAG: hypothetical protein EOS70_32925 [Mesorhizobium sp.]RWC37851.1 MAG: hypothetical protein EOS54_28840 [Mesorhizobium sp.]RWD40825.1 MAG: hypothetical protein EOS35_30345 [Mesorhizobium sp.]
MQDFATCLIVVEPNPDHAGTNGGRNLDGNKGVEVQRFASGQFCNVNIACDAGPFNNPKVRKAQLLTANSEAILQFVTEGFGHAGQ